LAPWVDSQWNLKEVGLWQGIGGLTRSVHSWSTRNYAVNVILFILDDESFGDRGVVVIETRIGTVTSNGGAGAIRCDRSDLTEPTMVWKGFV
jgi:hypothetical protein